MSKNRVKYFDNSDMSVSFYLERLKTVADSVDPATYTPGNINDALELLNIVRFIDNGLFHREWEQSYTDSLKAKSSAIKKLLGKYFGSLTTADIENEIKGLEQDYYENFIAIFAQYKLGDKVTEEEFDALLSGSGLSIWDILASKYLVEKYPDTVKERFLANPRNFETFLSNYTYSHNKKMLYIPSNISKQEMLALCDSYVESDEANSNYLDILLKPIKGTEKYITIGAAMKLKIKKRAEEIQEKLFGDLSSGGGLRISIAVLSSKEAYDKEMENSSSTDMIAYIDSSWLEKHHDYPTILNNFQYLYELFSDDLISTMPSFPNKEMGVFERHMGVKTENSYTIGQYFGLKHQLTAGKMRMASELLSRHDIRLEDVIDWFFSTYCKEEFSVEWLPLNMPSKDESIGNKTATLFRIEENIRTQYEVLVTEGAIDGEIVNMTNTPSLRSLPSFTTKKYAHLSDDDISLSIMGLLYSDQSSIVYIDESKKGDTFVALITSHDLKLSDFHDYQRPRVQFLIDHGVIVADGDGILGYKDIHELYIYKKLFAEGVIGYDHSTEKVREALDNMQSKGRVTFQSSLFSTQESDYLNFVLNNSQFDNSWAIRNSYQHGTPVYKSDDRYMFDYQMALLVLITYVIKINDELTLRRIAQGGEPAYVDFD